MAASVAIHLYVEKSEEILRQVLQTGNKLVAKLLCKYRKSSRNIIK